MRKLLFLIIISICGCGNFNVTKIKCYRNDKLEYEGIIMGNIHINSERNSISFIEKDTGKYITIYGKCSIIYNN